MLLRYVLKVSAKGYCCHHPVKANNAADALLKFINKHLSLEYTKIEIVGDPLPPPKTAIQLVKEAQKEKAAKKRRWVAAQKYQLKSGISVFAKPKN